MIRVLRLTMFLLVCALAVQDEALRIDCTTEPDRAYVPRTLDSAKRKTGSRKTNDTDKTD